jgi:hypothetical protein
MNTLPRKAHRVRRSLFLCLITLSILLISDSNEPVAAQQAGWRVTLEEGKTTRASLTLHNRCPNEQSFSVESDIKYLKFEGPIDSILIPPGGKIPLWATFDSAGLKIGVRKDELTVHCRTCKQTSPRCSQDRDTVPVELTVTKATALEGKMSPILVSVEIENGVITGIKKPDGKPVAKNVFAANVLTDGEILLVGFDKHSPDLPAELTVKSDLRFSEETRNYMGSDIRGLLAGTYPVETEREVSVGGGSDPRLPGPWHSRILTIIFPPRHRMFMTLREGTADMQFVAFDVINLAQTDRSQTAIGSKPVLVKIKDNTILELKSAGGGSEKGSGDIFGAKASFDGGKLKLEFDRPLSRGKTVELTIKSNLNFDGETLTTMGGVCGIAAGTYKVTNANQIGSIGWFGSVYQKHRWWRHTYIVDRCPKW